MNPGEAGASFPGGSFVTRVALASVVGLVLLAGCQINDGPTISSISPTSGPLAGGNQVTVNGANFDAHTKVYIGAQLCSNITFVGTGAILATVPPMPVGQTTTTVDVAVKNRDGQRDH